MKVATFQKSPVKTDLGATLKIIREDLEQCEKLGTDVVCFPECYLTGYHQSEEAINSHALKLDGPEFISILKRWSHFKSTIILGLIERSDDGLFNTAVVVKGGKLQGYYRKRHVNENHFGAGEEMPVFERDDIVFGINICNDANYPETALRVSEQGAKMLFYPLNNLLSKQTAETWRPKSKENLRLRAHETGCWVISSDVAGSIGNRTSYGCTQIVSPNGEVIASVNEFENGFALHELPI